MKFVLDLPLNRGYFFLQPEDTALTSSVPIRGGAVVDLDHDRLPVGIEFPFLDGFLDALREGGLIVEVPESRT